MDIAEKIDRLIERDEHDKAFRLCITTAAREPALHDELWEKAYNCALLTESERTQESFLSACRRIMKTEGETAEVLRQAATVYDAKGEHRLSLPLYRKLLAMELSTAERRNAHYQCASALCALRRPQEARSILLPVMRRLPGDDPHYAPYYGLMAEIEGDLGQPRLALPWLERAAKLDPWEPCWVRQAAEILEGLGEWERAARHWERILSLPKIMAAQAVCDQSRPAWKAAQFAKERRMALRRRQACRAAVEAGKKASKKA